ncbi:MAG: hypothetical protein IAG10_29395 [Planctomycetaceae bacterium]|nr:hypothetical protein [Planctomycetaceae bacterium]
MKPPELALDRDLLGDIKTRVRPPRPAERVRFQFAQGHEPRPHLCKRFTTCAANGNPTKQRLAIERGEHPTAIRFHRACSWVSEAEQLDPVRHADQKAGSHARQSVGRRFKTPTFW